MEPIDLGIPGLANIERIGAGGNAVVYRAQQTDLDRVVVVKVLTAVDAEATRRRFDRERRAMGRLSQMPGIAPVYGSGFTPAGQPWLLMPYYERGSLQEVLDTEGPRPPEEVRTMGVRICRAVHTAHESGVLHRDLKPANILVSRAGQPDVADFGIAHLLDETQGVSQALTMTPLYTAPEVFDGVDSGVASDVYSLGALLYALANGRPAFLNDDSGNTPMLALMRRINDEPLPALPDTVPPGLAAVIARAMSKDPSKRQASAAQLADELAAADLTVGRRARSTRLDLRAATPPPRPPQPSPPVPAPGAPSAGVPVASVHPGAVSAPHPHHSATAEAPPRSRKGLVIAAVVVALIAAGVGVAAALGVFGGDDVAGQNGPVGETVTPDVVTPDAVTPDAVTPDPVTPEALTPDPITPEPVATLDAIAVLADAEGAIVRIEAYSCTGAQVATGVVLDDGRILTQERVLASPWYIGVIQGDVAIEAAPLTMDLNRSLGLLMPAPGRLETARLGSADLGDRVVFVDAEGRSFEAGLVLNDLDRLAADLPLAEAVAIEHGTPAFNGTGQLVGTAVEGVDEVGMLPIADFEVAWNRTPPRFGCASTVRDLAAEDAPDAEHPHVEELLYLQRLSNAYANEDWENVRLWEPGKASLSDQAFIDGWRPLRQGFVFPVERTELSADRALWRIGLIGHETWNGTDLTTLFCLNWEVDRRSGQVVQTNVDTVRVYGSQPGQPQRAGFVDPADLRVLIDENCPL